MGIMKGLKGFAKKNINFKTLVKVATVASGAIPFAGGMVQTTMQGLSDAHAAKKANRIAEAQAKAEEAGQIAGNGIGSIAGQFINSTAKNAYQKASDDVKAGAGQTGALIVDSTINEWFKNHWKLVAGIFGGIVALFFVLPRMIAGGNSRPKRRF
jgi:hypothetical protein